MGERLDRRTLVPIQQAALCEPDPLRHALDHGAGRHGAGETMTDTPRTSKEWLDDIKARATMIGYDWPSNDTKREGRPERTIFPSGAPPVAQVCWDRQLLLQEVEHLQRRLSEADACLNHYQARFSLITTAWRSGDNDAILDAVRKHITAKDCEDADRLLGAAHEPPDAPEPEHVCDGGWACHFHDVKAATAQPPGASIEPCYCKRCDGKLPAPCTYRLRDALTQILGWREIDRNTLGERLRAIEDIAADALGIPGPTKPAVKDGHLCVLCGQPESAHKQDVHCCDPTSEGEGA
jgi:hypothetical protein